MKENDIEWEDTAGRFRVLAKWGTGGMADVYLARQGRRGGFDKLVALKVLREHIAEDPEFRAMFMEEVRTAALLNHPAIVQTFDSGQLGSRLYMVMEFFNGESLVRFARVVRREEGAFPAPLAAAIVKEVAEALHYAHTLRDLSGVPLELVHRDVSPSNVLISPEGRVKLLDFGIAKFATQVDSTRAGILKGKYAYMAPEQIAGEPVDHRTDIYALGVTLWQLLTGKKLFVGDSEIEVLRGVMNQAIPVPSSAGADCGPQLDAVVMRALSRNPSDRHETALEFARDLMTFLAAEAPGYDATNVIRDLMERHLNARTEQLRSILDEDNGIELGDEDSIPSFSGLSFQSSTRKLEALPIVEEGSRSSSRGPAERPDLRLRRRRWLQALIATAAIAIGLAAALATDGTRTLTITSQPDGAQVRLDDELVGVTPLELAIERDEVRRVSIESEGFDPWSQSLAAGEQPLAVHTVLTPSATALDPTPSRPSMDHVAAASPSFVGAECAGTPCEVRIDGEVVGNTPLARHPIPSNQSVLVELRRDGRQVARERLRLAAGELHRVMGAVPFANSRAPADRRRPADRRQPAKMAPPPAEATPTSMPASAPASEFDSNPYLRGR